MICVTHRSAGPPTRDEMSRMPQPAQVDQLDPSLAADVLAVAVRATGVDGVRPLNEETVLDLRPQDDLDPEAGSAPADELPTRHLVVTLDDPGVPARPHVAAYAHVVLSEPPSAEIVVAPDDRRQGHGRRLLEHLLQEWPAVRVWAHGDLPAARSLARDLGLSAVRDLWAMSRPLAGEWSELPDVPLPEGFAVRPFRVGSDEQSWLEINRLSFASNPEQAHVTLADLRARIAEPWFDPSGFLIIEDQRQQPPRMAAFHWTKVEAAEPGGTSPRTGEVYVVGVHPDYQGQGLGKVTTVLGLLHLRAAGLATATLYVDGDNEAAIATYHRLGFERSAVDVMYAAEGGD